MVKLAIVKIIVWSNLAALLVLSIYGLLHRDVLQLMAALLAVTGSLSTLVEAASLVFLFAFDTVNVIARDHIERRRWIPWEVLLLVV